MLAGVAVTSNCCIGVYIAAVCGQLLLFVAHYVYIRFYGIGIYDRLRSADCCHVWKFSESECCQTMAESGQILSFIFVT